MKLLFACGGTAGHINPAIATANYIKRRRPGTEVLFIGSPKGMEARLVREAGYDFAPVEIKGIQRRLNWHNVKYNLSSLMLLATCWGKIRRVLRDFSPDVVVGTGGYVSGPVLRLAGEMGIPTVTHESNAYPGVTTKLVAKTADRVLLAVPEAAGHLQCKNPPVVTGSPVREEILFADREAARKKLGVGERICVLSFGGSLGAERINRAMAQVVAHFAPSGRTHHIHATGSYGTELFPDCLRELGADIQGDPHMDIREYIRDMADCLAAADLVICRAGAMTLTELEAAGRASVLIPSPNVAENHQYHNAMVLQDHDAAVVIEEKDLTGERLIDTIERLIADPARLAQLGQNAASLARIDAGERICAEILSLAGQDPPNSTGDPA
ncbi:MAG: undecaprenyldiphospho-muramoylpentapeptide beta-N-acetylglucosaminyltransferase [Clostridiales bacterium]|nr:undecaprenyldiphospho-muramoylpentapeptide beta-N-acetylglucosaminyltransferase [Clostridiales bacterium]